MRPRLNAEQQFLFSLEQKVNPTQRWVYLDSVVDNRSAAHITRSLLLLDGVSSDPITIYINTDGGEDVSGMSIVDCIESLNSTVTGIVLGGAFSMGSIILQACDWRIMTPRSYMMIHWGSADVRTEMTHKHDAMMMELYLKRIREKHPTFSYKRLDKMLLVDTYLSADQAIELGLADEKGNAKPRIS